MPKFFINRPIVAMVIAIIMVIGGVVCILGLPTALFPNIADPQVQVKATYVGADAQTVATSVATPIEQQMSGVNGMNYMYSLNANNGQSQLTIDFNITTDINTDQILSQMREGQAASQLPSEVNNYGVTIQPSTQAPMMLFDLYSPNGEYDAKFLANYAFININYALTRIPGIASVQIFGAGNYAMRIWVNPDQLAKLQITVPEIVNAVQQQNNVNPAGQVGGEPVPQGQKFTYAVRTQGRLTTPEQFGEIVVKAKSDGSIVRVRDLGRVELGAQVYNLDGRMNGKPSAIVAIYQQPGSNLVDAANKCKALMAEAKKSFPPGLDYAIALDTSLPVTAGIHEIVKTLVEAMILVIIVVFIFLQGWRATLIPLLAVPVSLVGTFAIFPLLGFSINTLSLFGMVLAIGLVVDDAIVVTEAVEQHIEHGLSPKDAALKAMEEVSGPVVGIALVLSAVFIPTAFIPGITGRMYQQFAVTIAVSVLISAFNALSLSPALAALLLRPKKESRGPLAVFFRWFNRVFGRTTDGYVGMCKTLIHKAVVSVILLVGFALLAGFFGKKVPAGFLPDEDQGYVFAIEQLPDASSQQRASATARQLEDLILKTPGVEYCTTVVGFNLLSGVQATYNAFFWISFKNWDVRKAPDEQYAAIKAHLNDAFRQVPGATALSFPPPAIPGIGASGGLQFLLEDRVSANEQTLATNLTKFMDAARKRPEIGVLFTTALMSVPQVYINVDTDKVLAQGVPLKDVFQTLQAFMGGAFINYFNRFGLQWQTYVQAEGDYRTKAENVGQFYVKNNKGEMVPMSTLTSVERRMGPEFVMHYNLYNCAQIVAGPAPGYSALEAMAALESVFRDTMPSGMGYDYMGMSFQMQLAQKGVPVGVIFGLSLLFVFLVLAALYESWTLPFSVLLSTPIAVFGAFAMLYLRRTEDLNFETNIYAQIGLVMLIGLAAKNAILIVEFAKAGYDAGGKSLAEAALEGAKLRLRPILMTSFAFILGCVPLWRATGSGAISRQVMGTTVIGGMMASSLIAVFIIPALFYIVEKLSGAEHVKPVAKPEQPQPQPPPQPLVPATGD
ncbi:MAG: efflux RND transporter permease subunit [Acidobacteriaceae bacterium]|nr:efflux RND transporter permease subunit [Acidobacteriaceae bacterium]MBV8570744.1 efflux RND transporter permease subunit [Acidobacteriaceae bacterium]